MAGLEWFQWNNRVRIFLGTGRVDGSNRQIIDGKLLRGSQLGNRMGRESQPRPSADDGPGLRRTQVVLPDMQSEAEQGCMVCPVVENEILLSFGAGGQGLKEWTVEGAFVPDLNPIGATVDSSLQDVLKRMTVEVGGIQDWIERHYS